MPKRVSSGSHGFRHTRATAITQHELDGDCRPSSSSCPTHLYRMTKTVRLSSGRVSPAVRLWEWLVYWPALGVRLSCPLCRPPGRHRGQRPPARTLCQAGVSIARGRAEVRNGRTSFSIPLALQRETLRTVPAARHRGFRRVLSVESAPAGVVGLRTVTGKDGDTFQYGRERSLVLTLTFPGGASCMLPTWTSRLRTRAISC